MMLHNHTLKAHHPEVHILGMLETGLVAFIRVKELDGRTCPIGVAGCEGDGAEKEWAGAWAGGPPRDGGRLALVRACNMQWH